MFTKELFGPQVITVGSGYYNPNPRLGPNLWKPQFQGFHNSRFTPKPSILPSSTLSSSSTQPVFNIFLNQNLPFISLIDCGLSNKSHRSLCCQKKITIRAQNQIHLFNSVVVFLINHTLAFDFLPKKIRLGLPPFCVFYQLHVICLFNIHLKLIDVAFMVLLLNFFSDPIVGGVLESCYGIFTTQRTYTTYSSRWT